MDVNLTEVVEFLNEYLIEEGGRNPDLYEASDFYIDRKGKSALGRTYATRLLDEFGIIAIKTLYMPDENKTRIWFEEVEVTEEVVTETVQKVEMA